MLYQVTSLIAELSVRDMVCAVLHPLYISTDSVLNLDDYYPVSKNERYAPSMRLACLYQHESLAATPNSTTFQPTRIPEQSLSHCSHTVLGPMTATAPERSIQSQSPLLSASPPALP